MTTTSETTPGAPARPGPFEIRSEARGPHWIAWIVRAGSEKPDRGIVVVGETQAEAEVRARRFAEDSPY